MTIRVALHHNTRYRYDRPVAVSPHEIRLRPAVHCRTPIHSYSLTVKPEKQFINWQQDAYGNYVARLVFPEKTRELEITVDLVADMTVINPFDFFVEEYAEQYPFEYRPQLAKELTPFLERDPPGPLLAAWLADFRANSLKPGMNVNDFLVALNQRLSRDINYLIRMEPGVQTPEETLARGAGSCRDSAWMLCQILRDFGLASRFASGYLIQLTADVKALDGPSGPEADFTDLHAWTEAYLPGAGWIGLDPTSGLLAGEGHIPLACTAFPSSAAPVVGFTDVCECDFHFEMKVTRIHEDPRVTKPFHEEQWQAIEALGHKVDAELAQGDVRLTLGGEPTFVSIDDMDGPEWNINAHGEKKRELAGILQRKLKAKFAPGGLLHFGQGKWYPGEPLPRWALGIYWRGDGLPLWRDDNLIAAADEKGTFGKADARRFVETLAQRLGLSERYVMPAYEDVWQAVTTEQNLPDNVDPLERDLKDAEQRSRLATLLDGGLGEAVGYLLPIKPVDRGRFPRGELKPAESHWQSSRWPLKRKHVYLIAGDSPMGLRLPLASLPWVAPDDAEIEHALDPFAEREALGAPQAEDSASRMRPDANGQVAERPKPKEVIHTALCAQIRDGRLNVFMPPLTHLEDYVNLVSAVEGTAAELKMPLRLEGYTPPSDPRMRVINVTPDPGVIEVNIHPAASWDELVANVTTLYEEARLSRLGTEKFMLDGRHTGTGGGNHVTLGARSPQEPHHILAEPSCPLVSLFRHVRRADEPGATGGRSTGRQSLRARDRVPADGREADAREAQQSTMAGRPTAAQLARRPDRQHPPGGVLHRQALLTRWPDRSPGTARVPRLRDAATPTHEPAADAAPAGAGRTLLARAVSGTAGELGHPVARSVHAAALRRARSARRGARPARRRLPIRAGVVRAFRGVPLPPLRHGRV